MIARHTRYRLALAVLAVSAWRPAALAAPPDVGPKWEPLDPQTMPGVFYDRSSIKPLSDRSSVMAVTVAWFYAQPRMSEANGQPYRSVTQLVTLNCGNNTYTVDSTLHYAGENATGHLVEALRPQDIRNAPVDHDPVQSKLRGIICPNAARARSK